MTPPADAPSIEEQIARWREYLRRRRAIHHADVEELEGHLRDQIGALTDAGLDREEALLVAVKRMGSLDAVSREFAREHSERLWKQLVIGEETGGRADTARRDGRIALALAVAAGCAVKLPALFGVPMVDGNAHLYGRNASLFVLPLLTGYFCWKRRMPRPILASLALTFVIAAAAANTFPFTAESDTEGLAALHLPIALWLGVGAAYVGGRWFSGGGRMDFVRFSGELVVYYVLIAIGGGVFMAFTMMLFRAIGTDASWLVQRWVMPCGAAGAIIIASWLVEAKQSVVENMAPVLTRLFTPLFTLLLLGFLGTMAWTGHPLDVERDVLIAFDLLLVLVVALVLYATSARDPHAPPGIFDRLQLLLIVSALAVDAVALAAIATRISAFGSTPNRAAALGENLVLLTSLAGSAWHSATFLAGRTSFAPLERWQTTYLPIYSAWATVVVLAFPPIFGFA